LVVVGLAADLVDAGVSRPSCRTWRRRDRATARGRSGLKVVLLLVRAPAELRSPPPNWDVGYLAAGDFDASGWLAALVEGLGR